MARLNDLPLSIIETILCLIPIQEAGRTSILSREWRYRWTKMPKLVFEEKNFQLSTIDGAELYIQKTYLERLERKKETRSKLISAVGQVLIRHDGPLHEFTLSLLGQDVKIDHILTHLSRKTSIKKLELDFASARYRLPDRLPSPMSSRTLLHCLSSCPLLKTVILNIDHSYFSGSSDGPTFMKLLECLPVIETLSLSFDLINAFEDNVHVPGEVPTPLFHLKYLSIHDVCFSRYEEFILAFLIKSSPNLEKLKIFDNGGVTGSSKGSPPRVEYAGIMMEHLNELEIKNLGNHKSRLNFLKLILAGSPLLKKVRINGHRDYEDDYEYDYEKFDISETLSAYSCASPEVQIIVDGPIYRL